MVDAVTLGKSVADYGPLRIHGDTRLTLRDPEGGTHSTRLFGSMGESSEGWKVYSYIVD